MDKFDVRPVATLLRVMSQRRQRQIIVVVGLMAIGAIAELLTIGAVFPFLILVVAPHRAVPRFDWLPPIGNNRMLTATILLVVAAIAAALLRLLLTWMTLHVVTRLGHDIADRMFDRMLRQPYAVYLTRSSSQILSGVEKVQFVVFGVLQPGLQAVSASVIATFIGAFLFYVDPLGASIAAAALLVIYMAMGRVAEWRLIANSQRMAEASIERIKIMQEGIGGMRDVILDRSHAVFGAAFRAADLRYRQAQSATLFMSAAPRFIIEGAAIVFIALGTLALSSRPGGAVAALPLLGAMAFGAQRLLPLIQQAYNGWSMAAGNRQLLYDVVELLDSPIRGETAGAHRHALPFEHQVVLRSVSFRHDGAAFDLRNIQLEIRRGMRLGIRGATGSGKSTLLDLLMGLLEPTAGEIRIDGHRLDDSNRSQWQAQIGHVPQSVFLSGGSVASNIAFGVPPHAVDMERVRAAAAAAHAHEFIVELAAGYATLIGERGVRLSGGQRQRIGIARALYKGASVLVLDEATNALDVETEEAIMRSIMAADRDTTIVIVAHRESTLRECDRVITLAHGRILTQ